MNIVSKVGSYKNIGNWRSKKKSPVATCIVSQIIWEKLEKCVFSENLQSQVVKLSYKIWIKLKKIIMLQAQWSVLTKFVLTNEKSETPKIVLK